MCDGWDWMGLVISEQSAYKSHRRAVLIILYCIYPFAIILLTTTSYCLANIAYPCYKEQISLYFQQKNNSNELHIWKYCAWFSAIYQYFLNSQTIVWHIRKKFVPGQFRIPFCAGGCCRSSTLTHCLISLATSLIFDQLFLAFFVQHLHLHHPLHSLLALWAIVWRKQWNSNALPYLASFIHHSSSISLFFACSIICAKDPEPDRDTLGKLQIVSNIISLIFRHPAK